MQGTEYSNSSETVFHFDSLIAQSQNQVWCRLGDEAAILNLAAGAYYGLDPVGTRIWELIAQPARLDAVRDALVTEYDVEPPRCEQDLRRFLAELAGAGLIDIRNETEGV